MVVAAGYASATTVERRRARGDDDAFELPRVMIARSDHLAVFWMKIATAFEDSRQLLKRLAQRR
jgi:hypothetical protein